MKEFIEKLVGRLEEEKNVANNTYMNYELNVDLGRVLGLDKAIENVNQLAEEYNNDFCQWKYNGIMYDICPHTETRFARIHNCDENIFKFCPYCGKKIKIAPYQPKGE